MDTPQISYRLRLGSPSEDERLSLKGLSPVDDSRWNLRLDNSAFYVVALDGNLPVGFAFAENPWGEAGESWAKYVPGALELGGLIVRPEYRRQGIMAELVRLRTKQAHDLGYKPVCVTVADNKNVIAYYSSRGWTQRKTFERFGLTLIPWVLEGNNCEQ
jgi:GNAT superfamily N-acetyltransferase